MLAVGFLVHYIVKATRIAKRYCLIFIPDKAKNSLSQLVDHREHVYFYHTAYMF